MKDEELRQLERLAAGGDLDAERKVMCWKIGKFQQEIPVRPDLLRIIPNPGRYLRQEVVDGYPCLVWQAALMEHYYDLRTGEHRKTLGTQISTMSIISRMSQYSNQPHPWGDFPMPWADSMVRVNDDD